MPFWPKKTDKNQRDDVLDFSVETLEDRQMLAGDVSAAINGSELLILGDQQGNGIEIEVGDGTITVSGNGTDINGGRDPLTFDITSVHELNINLSNGNNRVAVIADGDANPSLDFENLSNIMVTTGNGNDRISFELSDFESELSFLLIGSIGGNDRISFESNGVVLEELNQFVVLSTAGNSRVDIDTVDTTIGSADAAGFFVTTGAGRDRVNLNLEQSSILAGDLVVQTGSGQDQVNFEIEEGEVIVEELVLDSGDDSDRVNFEISGDTGADQNVTAATIEFLTGAGDDRLSVIADGSSIAAISDLSIETEFGRDQINLLADGGAIGSIGSFIVSSGDDNDRIRMKAEGSGGDFVGFLAGNFELDAGSGDDRIEAISDVDSSATSLESNGFLARNSSLSFLAGSGDDRIRLTASNSIDTGFLADQQIRVFGGRGEDRIEVIARNTGNSVGYSVGAFDISGNDGDDRITVNADNRDGVGFSGAILSVSGADGDDRVTVRVRSVANSIAYNSVFLGGGNGFDRLNNEYEFASIFDFEDV